MWPHPHTLHSVKHLQVKLTVVYKSLFLYYTHVVLVNGSKLLLKTIANSIVVNSIEYCYKIHKYVVKWFKIYVHITCEKS